MQLMQDSLLLDQRLQARAATANCHVHQLSLAAWPHHQVCRKLLLQQQR
jgi:hypothetical protein